MSCKHKIGVWSGISLSGEGRAKCRKCGEVVCWERPFGMNACKHILAFVLFFVMRWSIPIVKWYWGAVVYLSIYMVLETLLVMFFTKPCKDQSGNELSESKESDVI